MTVTLSHPNVRIGLDEINPNNYGQFRVLYNKVYSKHAENDFSKVITHPDFSRYVFYNDVAVGAIVVEQISTPNAADSKNKTSNHSYAIKQLLVLPAYRRNGLASRLIKFIIDTCAKDSEFTHLTVELNDNTKDPFVLEWLQRLGFSKQEESYIINNTELLSSALEKLKI